jgi:uncharacterized protein
MLGYEGEEIMAVIKEVERIELFTGRLRHGADLLEEITELCKQKNMRLGRVEAIGAVQKACIGFYDQRKREYRYITIDEPLEITNLMGNISMKDGIAMVHAHVTLANGAGKAFGGHLAPGTIIFAAEVAIEVLDGTELVREFDDETGLALWAMEK